MKNKKYSYQCRDCQNIIILLENRGAKVIIHCDKCGNAAMHDRVKKYIPFWDKDWHEDSFLPVTLSASKRIVARHNSAKGDYSYEKVLQNLENFCDTVGGRELIIKRALEITDPTSKKLPMNKES